MTDSLPSWARVGAKCVYTPRSGRYYSEATYPVAGNIYTIRDIVFAGPRPCLLLEEIDNAHVCDDLHTAVEPAFGVGHFRPLHTVETDTAMFLSLLTPDAMGIVEHDLETAWERAR